MKIHPITKIVVEDVKFNHFKNSNGASFSLVEIGKTRLYEFIRERTKLELILGTLTHKLRIDIFGHDIKIQDKGSKRFEAHCVDSFAMALNGIAVDSQIPVKVNRDVIFIEKKCKSS